MFQRSSRRLPRGGRRPRVAGLTAAAALVAAVLGWFAGLIQVPGVESPLTVQAQIGGVPAAQLTAAKASLAAIPVKGRAPKTGYARSEFGEAWADTDHNGCDTRNDVLARDLRGAVFKAGTRDCVVLSGSLEDPYTGTTIPFQRGERSAHVQIDHIVPLSDAWQKGAQQWTAQQRLSFANDPANLRAVDGPANQQKSDGDLATWLPPNRSFRCEYAVDVVELKAGYGLWMTQAEHDKAAELLGACRAE
ncbi:Excalibur domain containing protein [Sinomonas atrocyanea]|uniref:Excalibur domain containing protein n=1 Tax=Sinomonas atrocyanea TaxID=37927 RepID=A0A126ZXG9_9MICC|nr:HNH endonuclease family protein [Sinomonas atrocyanea]AMM31870.1 Excalibur domain containing protein [Sinomonas atrocyanea]